MQVRGKTVYLQYSTRQEIVNATSSAEEPSNVLLATLENLQPDTVITIEQLWAVFAAFGNVQKIATFEKSAGFQALVQYETAQLAKAAKEQLDGRTIPRSILQSRTPCQLRIAFSGHRDLNVKYQSHRGRDFTNPDLPWADVDPEVAAKGIQGPMTHSPEDGNVLLVQVS
jgi:polypyrimidine tract-binding protein 2